MKTEVTDAPAEMAVEQLVHFGLSMYAARTFVALVGLGTGTARDVSQTSEVPRTRVYDAMDELHELGLVDVLQTSPKRFRVVSASTAARTFERELTHRTAILQEALGGLEPIEPRTEQHGVWTVNGARAVSDRLHQFFATAENEIVYMTVEELLTEELVESLHDAAERGVSIKLAGISAEVASRIESNIPNAITFESLWVWSDTPAGRLVMVDGRKTLVSVIEGDRTDPEASRAETAIWGEGETNSLVVILRAIFTWRLEREEPD